MQVTSGLHTFRYEGVPENKSAPKVHVLLGRTDLFRAAVQVVREGGDNNLHAHTGNDGFWMVLQGRAAFYDGHGNMFEIAAYEGVIVPRNTSYWFKPLGPETLEILHIAAQAQNEEDRRVDLEERQRGPSDTILDASSSQEVVDR